MNDDSSAIQPGQAELPPFRTLVLRGWRKRCPQCGKGAIYVRWLTMHTHCPACGLRYLANQGDLLGPLFFIDRVCFIIPFIVLFFFRVWYPSVAACVVVGVLMFAAMVLTMPNRNGVSLAIDYLLRRRQGDLAETEPRRDA